MNNSFPKNERLCRQKLIRQVFETGASASVSPLRMRWISLPFPGEPPLQILIVVPKSSFPRAVDRNLIRRRIRECYRLNSPPLHESLVHSKRRLAVAILYTGRDILSKALIQEKIIVLLQRLLKENEKASG